MSEQDVRIIIVEALEYANAITMRDKGIAPLLLEGQDLPLGDFEMDSLALMELCIAIEVNTGVTIVPEDLQSVSTLNGLVETVRARIK